MTLWPSFTYVGNHADREVLTEKEKQQPERKKLALITLAYHTPFDDLAVNEFYSKTLRVNKPHFEVIEFL